MPSSSASNKHAVSSSAETGATEGGGADDGSPSEHKRMRLDDDDRKPSTDPHADLELAFQRRAQALADLQGVSETVGRRMEGPRQEVRTEQVDRRR